MTKSLVNVGVILLNDFQFLLLFPWPALEMGLAVGFCSFFPPLLVLKLLITAEELVKCLLALPEQEHLGANL